MVRKSRAKPATLLEPETGAPSLPVSEGTIGVEYTPPPVGEREEEQKYLCANCQGEIELRSPRCQTCNESIDWSSLDG
ncbi:MAG TPA: hypothetical protein EYN66_19045 [Myxococcales bacterium]|nr:hypothetical protein [Myxococcales bacterium]